MFLPQYWTTRLSTSLFQQTVYETEREFYATFPAARAAACNATLEQILYDPTAPADYSTLHDGVQPFEYYAHNEKMPNISSPSSPSFSDITQQQHIPLHFNYSRIQHYEPSSPSYYQEQPTYYSPPPVVNDAAVYIPSERPYYHQHSSESISPSLTQSSSSSISPDREQNPYLVNQQSHIRTAPNVNTYRQETTNDNYVPESPKHDFCQLNRHMKPPTLKFTNNCQLAVMRLDRLSEQSHSSKQNDAPYASSSKTMNAVPSQTIPTPTEFLLNSPKSPSIGLSSLPSKNIPERKPPLACLFCRGRKIACGPPLPGSIKKTCNQCRKRSLQCHYPSESRRGMRKKKTPNSNTDTPSKMKSESK